MKEADWLASVDPAAMIDYLSGPPKLSDRKSRLFACACVRQVWHLLTDERIKKAAEVAEMFADGKASGVQLQVAHDLAHRAASDANAGYESVPWLGFYVADNRSEYAIDSRRSVLGVTHEAGVSRETQANLLRDVVGNSFRPLRVSRSGLTTAEVKARQASVYGCCDRHADNSACDCLALAGDVLPGWLSPLVVSLAQAAYDERRRKCRAEGCKCGRIITGFAAGNCTTCHGTGTIDDGTLDPDRLAVLSDALEDGGCPQEPCIYCGGKGFHQTGLVKCDGQGIHDSREEIRCVACDGSGRVPHPLLEHLRSDGPHVRGCWVLDLLLGKS